MKRVFNKNTLVMLALATAGLSSAAQAASSATITIKATVAERFEVKAPTMMTLSATENAKDEDIHITSNLAGSKTKAKVTVEANTGESEGKHLILKQGTNTLKMAVKLGNAELSEGKAEVTDAVAGTPVKLRLERQENGNQAAGEYTGTLTVKVEKA